VPSRRGHVYTFEKKQSTQRMIDHPTRRFISLVLLLLVTVTAGTWCKKDSQSTYSENLATHRNKFKAAKSAVKKTVQATHKKKPAHITPVYAITDQLDYLLARKKEVSKQIKHVQGYTIQAYVGGSRDEALRIKNKLYTHYPAIEPEVTYDLPHYTVRIGKFLEKLEAYPAYAAIRKQMPQVIIRPISFVNQPHVFINKQAAGQRNTAPSVPTSDECAQKAQEQLICPSSLQFL
jgi:hypothetical protein